MNRRILALVLAILVLGLASCSACQHAHGLRVFVLDPPEPLHGNLFCPDCVSVVSSWTYERPWLGPPTWLPSDTLVLRGRALPGLAEEAAPPADEDEKGLRVR